MRLSTRLSNHRKGAALVEYGILLSLIAVLSVGSVLLAGQSVKKLFSATESEVSAGMQFSTVAPPSGPQPITWTFTAGHTANGSGNPFRGYRDPSFLYPVGSVGAWTGPSQMIAHYTYVHTSNPNYLTLMFAGDQRSEITNTMIVTCDDGSSYPVSGSSGVIYYDGAAPYNTQMTWSNAPMLFTPGNSYTCSIAEP